ncbi:Transcriptional regulator, AraC family [Acidisarcina polymorpha]|uniref:Transcriptional regulator, AraC family n=1 Tax=Acidisarcina polymorpha TaxID=2211140 RepID=A0A2Z5G5S5_9BACT|nr:AraC family transcriptional regulator [Acidisarcina polymorpha]AXC13906.1 Transcriptional regulator, AraC family [Acidisarcina polymorpha]
MLQSLSVEDVSRTIPHWESVHSVVESQIRADGFHDWPFIPSFPVDVRAFSFGEHRSVRPTWHDYYELLYVCSGEALYEVQDQQFQLRPLDLMIVSDSLYHRLSKVVAVPFKALVLYFMPDVLRADDNSGDHEFYLSSFRLQREGFPHMISGETGVPMQVLRLMVKIRNLLPAMDADAQLVVRTYLEMVLVLLMNHDKEQLSLSIPLNRNHRSLERMRPLFDFIEEKYRTAIPLSTASAIAGMSKPHFMRSFKRATGQSFDTYLNRFRIAKSQVLLATTNMAISAVGQEVGFADQSYFGLVFRRLVKVSPREYRNSVQAK